MARPKVAEMPDDVVVLDAVLHLFDRQVIDSAGHFVCNVDDLELSTPRGRAAPYVTAILAGPAALGPRLGGLLGRWLVAVQRRLHPDEEPQPARIDFGDVVDVDAHVAIDRRREGLAVNLFEEWCRENVIAKIPGASHDGG